MTKEEAAEQLRSGSIWDPAHRLDPAGQSALEEALESLEGSGLEAKIVLLPAGERTADWRELWKNLGLDAEADLLLIDAGGRWEARGWGLSSDRIGGLLDAAEASRDKNLGQGLSAALGSLRAASPAAAEAPAEGGQSSNRLIGALGLGGLMLLSGMSFLYWRRGQVAAAAGAEVEAARSEAETTLAALALRAEELDPEHGRELQDRAASLTCRLRAAAREPGETELRVGRLRQIEAEAAALHATLLQKRGR